VVVYGSAPLPGNVPVSGRLTFGAAPPMASTSGGGRPLGEVDVSDAAMAEAASGAQGRQQGHAGGGQELQNGHSGRGKGKCSPMTFREPKVKRPRQ
jgi:hypothetical protein